MNTYKEQQAQDTRDASDARITMTVALIVVTGLLYGFCQALSHL